MQELVDKNTLCTFEDDVLRKMQGAFTFNHLIGAFDNDDMRYTFLLCCDGDDGWMLHICKDARPEPIEMRTIKNAQWMDLDLRGLYDYAQAIEELADEIDIGN